jgi:hypothetical protein
MITASGPTASWKEAPWPGTAVWAGFNGEVVKLGISLLAARERTEPERVINSTAACSYFISDAVSVYEPLRRRT